LNYELAEGNYYVNIKHLRGKNLKQKPKELITLKGKKNGKTGF
jgi:hypothetical protein